MDEAPLVSYVRPCVCFPGCWCFIPSSYTADAGSLVNGSEMAKTAGKRKRVEM